MKLLGNTRLFLSFVASLFLIFSVSVHATPISGELFYTTYAGGTNVHKVDYNFDGVSFAFSNNTGIAAVRGADGISGNPNDANSLFIGGQGSVIHRISKTGTLLQDVSTPSAVFHLEVADSSTLYGTSIPSSGSFSQVVINPNGSLGAASSVSIVGDVSTLTQVISTPTQDFYTSSGSGGFGSFGYLSIVGGVATTTQIASGVPAAHGGVFDAFSNSIILFGDGHISQYSLTGVLLDDLVLGGNFDQGTVDGMGHIFAANNDGTMTFIDYSASSLIGGAGNFMSTQFLALYLDDIAPLVGAGSTDVPEPASIALFGLGLLGLGFSRKKKKM